MSLTAWRTAASPLDFAVGSVLGALQDIMGFRSGVADYLFCFSFCIADDFIFSLFGLLDTFLVDLFQ